MGKTRRGACVYSVLVGLGILAWRHKRRREKGGCREITLFVIKWCFHFQSELLEECGFRDSGKHFLAHARGRQGADKLRNGFAKKLHPLFYTLLRYEGVEGIQVKDGDRNGKKQRGSFKRAANFTCDNLLISQEECCSAVKAVV